MKAAVATIDLKGFPDWIEFGDGSVWVSNPGLETIQRIDPATNTFAAEVNVNKPVAGPWDVKALQAATVEPVCGEVVGKAREVFRACGRS